MDQYMWMERKAAKGTGMYTSKCNFTIGIPEVD